MLVKPRSLATQPPGTSGIPASLRKIWCSPCSVQTLSDFPAISLACGAPDIVAREMSERTDQLSRGEPIWPSSATTRYVASQKGVLLRDSAALMGAAESVRMTAIHKAAQSVCPLRVCPLQRVSLERVPFQRVSFEACVPC